jgi:signal transduction histidine kinase
MIKRKKADELIIANKELAFQDEEKEKRAAELVIANKELAFQNDEKEKRAAELTIANKELAFQNDEKEKRAAELVIANKELAFQNDEKEKRAAELTIANEELAFQNDEKEKRAAELTIANKELAFQNDEKEKRAAELAIANEELAYQNEEKEKRAAEREKRAAELVIANKELAFQNDEKEKRAAELTIANKELAFQNNEKEKRAAELAIANKELAFQNDEKEKRAAELTIANKELAFQNDEKEKRAAELAIANKELAFQNDEKEKRAEELIIANKELLAFTYISGHDLQEPLRKIQTLVTIILEDEHDNLSDDGKFNFKRMQLSAGRMQQLIDDLLAFSRISTTELKFENIELKGIIEEVKSELKDTIQEKNAIIDSSNLGSANVIAFQFRQLMYNLISNALKFSNPGTPSKIVTKSRIVSGSELKNDKLSSEKNYCHITVQDNGIGFEPRFSERIFGVFQKLHGKEVYAGTGIGLAIVKKIVENHNGTIIATGELNKGATFEIYIPFN